MTNDDLLVLLDRVDEALRYDCLQSKKVVALIHETDAAREALSVAGADESRSPRVVALHARVAALESEVRRLTAFRQETLARQQAS